MRDLTILWALRSPCNLGCTYCYFGTIEDNREHPPDRAGQLSHLAHNDVSLPEIADFLETAADSAIGRVFIAGGEPLIWPHVFTVVAMLKRAGAEVVLCTNGIPLNRPDVIEQILHLSVDAVSISLDSIDPVHNDQYRPSRNRQHGWADVVSGIRALAAARRDSGTPKVGLYTAVTRRNIPAVTEVARLGALLGADYFVPQPISLDEAHPLHAELALRPTDLGTLSSALNDLYKYPPAIGLPERSYGHQFLSVAATTTQIAPACFGGQRLAFIEPDGSVWPCPSRYKIADTPKSRQRSIRGTHAAEMFALTRTARASECPFMSVDCVSMWPLMDFSRFLHAGPAA